MHECTHAPRPVLLNDTYTNKIQAQKVLQTHTVLRQLSQQQAIAKTHLRRDNYLVNSQAFLYQASLGNIEQHYKKPIS